MSRPALVRLHAAAGGIALLLITGFLLATVVVEALGAPADIDRVKTAIAFALLVLVPAMATAGVTGFRLAGGRLKGIIGRKAWRMKLIGANGLLVLAPAALFLAFRARSGTFDTAFAVIQALEILAGLGNVVLLGLNMRDGLILGRARRVVAAR